MLRKNAGYLNYRDEVACETLMDNMHTYMVQPVLLQLIKRLHKKRDDRLLEEKDKETIKLQISDVTLDVLEEAEVSKKELE